MYIKNQTFTVIGLSASGKAAADALLSRGGKVRIFDADFDNLRVKATVSALVDKGAIYAQDLYAAIDESDVIVISPGVKIDEPYLLSAKKAGKRIMGETELGYLLTLSPYIAVTGTNGKTTTCSLVSHILTTSGVKNELVGNIGTPVCAKIADLTEDTIAVTEVSSFQLESVNAFCPHVAAILNVTPDHLDRHYNMDNYVYLKKRLLSNMRESEFAVLNFDDEIVRGFATQTKAKVVSYSLGGSADGYIEDGYFCFRGEKVAKKESLSLLGEHNLSNALAAVCICRLLGAPCADVERGFATFKGVRHRIELIYTDGGVKYYNDSKSTNVDSTLKAVAAMTKPTVLILGGKDKNQEYDKLFEELKRSSVVHAVITGENRYKLLDAATRAGFMRVSVSASFESAIKIAKIEAKGDCAVLLSPACASFDNFFNYEERGIEFERIVKAINEKN